MVKTHIQAAIKIYLKFKFTSPNFLKGLIQKSGLINKVLWQFHTYPKHFR